MSLFLKVFFLMLTIRRASSAGHQCARQRIREDDGTSFKSVHSYHKDFDFFHSLWSKITGWFDFFFKIHSLWLPCWLTWWPHWLENCITGCFCNFKLLFHLIQDLNFQFEEKKALKLESSLSNSTHLAAHFGHSLNKNTHSSRAKPNLA